MNESSIPPAVPNETLEKPVRTTVWSRMLNVLAYPIDAFEEVQCEPFTHSNWLAPVLAVLVAMITYVQVIYTQPALLQQARDVRNKALEKSAADKKMSQEQADKAIEVSDRFLTPFFFKLIATTGAIFSTLISLVLIALGLWMVARWGLAAPIAYPKAIEICGLSATVWALGAIITMFLAMIQGSLFASPSLALFVKEFDATNRWHMALSSANAMTLWFIGLLSLGLAKLTGRSLARAAVWLFGFWLVVKVISIVWLGGKL